jgi:drug/metabolite transporter (DMT)-like permease
MTERSASAALSLTAFATLLLIALLMGANHVAARIAFDHGVDVATAVAVRSIATALVVGLLIVVQRAPVATTPRQRRFLPAIGLIVGVQSICLYSSVARLPVALALLAFNTYPLWTALWARVLYAHRPERRVVRAMPVMLLGLALALDVSGAASGLGASLQWQRIGVGVAFALGAAASFGLALVLTQHEVGALDGRLRTTSTMAIVAVMALARRRLQGGFHLPDVAAGWWGLRPADAALRHRHHHPVHGAAAPRRGRQLGDHERRAGVRAGAGLADPRPGDRAVAGGRARCWSWPPWCGSASGPRPESLGAGRTFEAAPQPLSLDQRLTASAKRSTSRRRCRPASTGAPRARRRGRSPAPRCAAEEQRVAQPLRVVDAGRPEPAGSGTVTMQPTMARAWSRAGPSARPAGARCARRGRGCARASPRAEDVAHEVEAGGRRQPGRGIAGAGPLELLQPVVVGDAPGDDAGMQHRLAPGAAHRMPQLRGAKHHLCRLAAYQSTSSAAMSRSTGPAHAHRPPAPARRRAAGRGHRGERHDERGLPSSRGRAPPGGCAGRAARRPLRTQSAIARRETAARGPDRAPRWRAMNAAARATPP